MPLPLAIPLIASAVATGANAISNSVTNSRNIRNQNMLWRQQQEQQNFLNANGALIKRQSLERAGLNVNADFGYSPALQASQPTPVQQQPMDFSAINSLGANVAQLLQQQPLIDAQKQKTSEEARSLKIENDRKVSEDAMLYNLDLIANTLANSKDIPELKICPFNAGALRAKLSYDNYRTTVAQNAVQTLIANKQIDDNEVITKWARLPVEQFNKIFNEALNVAQDTQTSKAQHDLFVSQKDLNELEEEMKRNGNLHELITKYLGDGAVADVCHGLVILLGMITGNMHFGANFSKFKGNTSSESHNTNSNTNRNINNNTSHSTVHHYSHKGN